MTNQTPTSGSTSTESPTILTPGRSGGFAAAQDDSAAPKPRRGPWHRRVGELHVIKVCGSFYDMGRQHGEMLREEIPHGPMPYYRVYLERLMGRQGWGPLSPIAWPLVQRLIGRRVMEKLPDFVQESVRGLADGAGLDPQSVLEGCTMPDSLVWVASRVMQLKRTGPAMHHRLALGYGCTSAIAHGGATADGALLHARNFDYHGVECWPRTATVIFHEPDDGLRYVSVAAAGVLLGGVTAMNEAGLTLTVHQHMFTDRTKLGGTPIGCVGDIIMRQARCLDDAEEILRTHQPPIGCWTYLITDGHRREVLCWEENPERHVAQRFGPEHQTFGYANIYRDRELGDTEQDLYRSYWRANLGRQRRMDRLLAQHAGHIEPADMAAFLADPGETRCRIASAIGMIMTVGSVVFRPEDGVLWVAAGQAPTSHRPFLPFDLKCEDHAPEHGTLPGGAPHDEGARTGVAAYRDAYLAYLDRRDTDGARAAMAAACAAEPHQPLYQVLHGLLSLQLGDGDGAFESLSRALELGHDHPARLASFHLWRARAADLMGQRERGLRDYRAALGHPADPPVRRAALQGLRRPYSQRRAQGIDVDFSFADVVSP